MITKVKTTTILLKSTDAINWINENISISNSQWDKDDDSGFPTIEIDSQFVDELIDSMTDELSDNDFEVIEK
jgi:hypothetical protein